MCLDNMLQPWTLPKATSHPKLQRDHCFCALSFLNCTLLLVIFLNNQLFLSFKLSMFFYVLFKKVSCAWALVSNSFCRPFFSIWKLFIGPYPMIFCIGCLLQLLFYIAFFTPMELILCWMCLHTEGIIIFIFILFWNWSEVWGWFGW
jgi:hypothetical protein